MNFYKFMQVMLGVILVGMLVVGALSNLNQSSGTVVNQQLPVGGNAGPKFNFN